MSGYAGIIVAIRNNVAFSGANAIRACDRSTLSNENNVTLQARKIVAGISAWNFGVHFRFLIVRRGV
jgi:hypothetical protein